MVRWKRLIPLLVSLGLLAFLLCSVPLSDFLQALAQLNWRQMLMVTGLFVVVLYFIDSVCLWWLFADGRRPLSYGTVLNARGCAYLFMIVHFSLGHGFLAWLMAKVQDKSLLSAAGRCVVMTYIDVCVLLSLGLLGALMSSDTRTEGIALFCGVALAVAVGLAVALRRMPGLAIEHLRQTAWGAKLESAELNWKQVASLYPLRLAYFIVGLFHIGTVLWISGIQLQYSVIMSVIPITAIVDGLPVSVSGLGTREAMLVGFLQPEQPAVLIACTMVWWVFVMATRAAIGLGNLWMRNVGAWGPAQTLIP